MRHAWSQPKGDTLRALPLGRFWRLAGREGPPSPSLLGHGQRHRPPIAAELGRAPKAGATASWAWNSTKRGSSLPNRPGPKQALRTA